MRDFFRRAIHHAIVPALLAVFYVAAHCHSISAPDRVSIMWTEGGVTRIGNPYTAPFLPIFTRGNEPDDENDVNPGPDDLANVTDAEMLAPAIP